MAKFKSDKNKSFGQNLYAQLLQNAGGQDYIDDKFIPRLYPNDPASMEAFTEILNTSKSKKAKKAAGESLDAMFAKHKAAQDAFAANPFKTKVDLGNGVTGNSLKNTLGMAGSAIKAHPLAAAGMGAMGAANIAGLVDDDKIGGQLVGGLAGGVIPAMMGANPMTAIALGLGGGTLGSLFDKLRAKKELEQQSMYQQQEY